MVTEHSARLSAATLLPFPRPAASPVERAGQGVGRWRGIVKDEESLEIPVELHLM